MLVKFELKSYGPSYQKIGFFYKKNGLFKPFYKSVGAINYKFPDYHLPVFQK